MTTSPSADHALLNKHLARKNTASLRLVVLLGGVLVPLFWILDWSVIPAHVWETGIIRSLTTVYAIVILLALWRRRAWVERYVDVLGFTYTVVVAWSIVVMCWLHAGFESPYYAGVNLVVIGIGVLFSWPFWLAVASCALIYLGYLAPLPLALLKVHSLGVAVGNQFFLLGTMVIVLAAQHHRYRLEAREFFANLDLQRTKGSLEDAVAKLRELDRAKTDFFANITHELRTPLTMILAPLDDLISGQLGAIHPSQHRYLIPMQQNALKLLKLVNDLLDVAKIEERHLRLRIEQADIEKMVRTIVEQAEPLATRKGVELLLEVRSFPSDVWIDVEQMDRVVINLVSNALKFTEEGGRVTVILDGDESGARITVRDTGIGIDEQDLRRVFERFSQVDGSVTRRYGGTGIGLALAKEMVELHGGRIDVRSVKGQGSIFAVHLVRGRDHFEPDVIERRTTEIATDRGVRAEDREPKEWTKKLLDRPEYRLLDIVEATERRVVSDRDPCGPKATKVLVVEDNIDVLRFLHLQLQDQHAVYLAKNGKQGLDLAGQEQPDVIITDYMMPEMDGMTLIGELRKDRRTEEIPIIMLTAKNRIEDRINAREAGADIYLSKPFSPRELRTAVATLLEKRGRQVSLVAREHVRSLEMISAGLAHEIHNPLGYIKNGLYALDQQLERVMTALADPKLDDDAKRAELELRRAAMQKLREAADRGIVRIEKVVELVRRYARDGYPHEPTPMLLDDAVHDIGRLIAPKTNTQVSVEIETRAPGLAVRCIPEEMHQAIRNLWQNALDAVENGGHVWVSTRPHDGHVLLQVRDDGPGIPREHLSRIFTPFFTTKDPGKGMGLGLAITLQVIDRAGGVLAVDSPPGKGTTFSITLPISPVSDTGQQRRITTAQLTPANQAPSAPPANAESA